MKKQRENCLNGQWSNHEKKKIAIIMLPIVNMQNQYGKNYDFKMLMRGWEIKLANKYTIDQIIYAVDIYTDHNNNMPTPSDIIEILNPKEPKVTEAQFVDAQKWQERNNWPMLSNAQETIERYRKQQKENNHDYVVNCQKISSILEKSVKRIEKV